MGFESQNARVTNPAVLFSSRIALTQVTVDPSELQFPMCKLGLQLLAAI